IQLVIRSPQLDQARHAANRLRQPSKTVLTNIEVSQLGESFERSRQRSQPVVMKVKKITKRSKVAQRLRHFPKTVVPKIKHPKLLQPANFFGHFRQTIV